jgi:hypothetical protein
MNGIMAKATLFLSGVAWLLLSHHVTAASTSSIQEESTKNSKRNLRMRLHDYMDVPVHTGDSSLYVECTLLEMDIIETYDYQVTGVSCLDNDTLANIEVHGLEENISALEWTSGVTVVWLLKAAIQSDMIQITANHQTEIIVQKEQTRTNLEAHQDRRLSNTPVTGVHKVLVVRVTALDGQPSFSAQQIGDSIFGPLVGGFDLHNLASQYKLCSDSKLTMKPHPSAPHGVLEVKININAGDSTGVQMQSKAAQTLPQSVRNEIRSGVYQHVMYCIPQPKNVMVAWAHSNTPTSVYNDKFCLGLSTQMHEVGHNLGLGHSGLGTDKLVADKYKDRSGYMGYSGAQDDKPSQCFNGPKSYQLGWYNNRVFEVDPAGGVSSFAGKLVGVAQSDATTADHTVIVHVTTPSQYDDIFVTYNRGVGMNYQTRNAWKDKVLVTLGSADRGSISWNLEQLDPISQTSNRLGAKYGFDDSRPLLIVTSGTGTDNTSVGGRQADYAMVYVGFQCSRNNDCTGGDVCDSDKNMCIPPPTRSWNASSKSCVTTGAASPNLQKASYGVMWDVAPSADVLITGVSILTTSIDATLTAHIWTKSGTVSNHQNFLASDSDVWTKQTVSVRGNGMAGLTYLPFDEAHYVKVEAGATQGFYIVLESSDGGVLAFRLDSCVKDGGVIELGASSSTELNLYGWYIWNYRGDALGGPNSSQPSCFNGEVHFQTLN